MSESPTPECVFCRIVAGEAEASVVHDDATTIAFMTIGPVNPGHVLVVPKQHYSYLADMPEDVGAHCCTVAQRLAAAIRGSGPRCEGVNIFLADGEAACQDVFHFHLHVFPLQRGSLPHHRGLVGPSVPTRTRRGSRAATRRIPDD
jgi:histidine triad (HIT) family protein